MKIQSKPSLYQTVTDKIIASLEQGKIPWERPWKTPFADNPFPRNFFTGKPYRGINILLLWSTPFSCPFWLTFRQVQELHGTVRKGEKGTLIVFYKPIDREEKEGSEGEEETKKLPFFLRYHTVFNVEQCDGIPLPEMVPLTPEPKESNEACSAIVDGYPNGPKLVLDRPHEFRAFYRPDTDTVHMPLRARFVNEPHYYSTFFHELIHSTGHASRLARTFGANFGDELYSKEELVAEMGSAFLCALAGIANEHTDRNTTAYLQNWISRLKEDNRLIIQAAGQAQKAVDLILDDQLDLIDEKSALPSAVLTC